jgi:hypothetical protein
MKPIKYSDGVSVGLKDGKATGIIIGAGLNLGTTSRAELLTTYGLDQSVVDQLAPYIGVKGPEALSMAKNLNVDNLNIDSINDKVQQITAAGFAKEFDKTSTTPFHKLSPTQQTLVATMQQTLLSPVLQKNSVINTASSVVGNAASGNWNGVLGNLVDFTNHIQNDDSFESRLINKMIKESEKKLKKEVKKQTSKQTKKLVDKVTKPKDDAKKKPDTSEGAAKKKEQDSKPKESEDSALKESEDSVEPTYSKWAGPSGDIKDLFEDDDDDDGKNEKEPEEEEEKIKFNAENGDVDEAEEGCPVKEKAEEKEEPVESEECEFVEMEVEKSERNFTYKWTPGGETTESKGLYEIVAGTKKKAATVNLKLKGLNTTCDTHKKTNWDLEKGPFKGGSNKLSCTSNKPKGLKNTLWPYGVPPKKYTVKGFTCTTTHSAIVHVYPDTHYLVNASWGFDIGDLFKSVKSPAVAFRAKVTHDGVDRELKIDKDNVSYNVENGSEIEKELAKRTNEMIKALMALKNTSASLVDDLKDESKKKEPVFKMNSKLELEFEWKWREKKGSPMCEFVVEGGLYSRPLLELSWNKEILGTAVLAIPYVGAFIKGTKTLLSHLDSGELSLKFFITGKLGFEIARGTWVLNEIEESKKFIPVKANGDITFKLEGKLEASVKKSFFGIKAGGSAGATIGAEAGFKIGEDTGLYVTETSTNVKMALDFTGLCVYAKAFCKVGLSFSVEGELPNSAKDRMSSEPTTVGVEAGVEVKKEKDNKEKDKDKKGYIIKEKKNLWTKTIEIT